MEVTFGPTEFLKAILADIEQVAENLETAVLDLDIEYAKPLSDCEEQLRKITSAIREYTSTKVTTIAGTTVISTTTDETK